MGMKKLLAGAGIIFLPVILHGQVVKYAIVKSDDIEAYNKAIISFKINCSGESVDFDFKKDGESIIGKIKSIKPRTIVTVGKAATARLIEAFPDIPLVFGVVLNPEELISLNSNVAGVSLTIPISKQLETLISLIPGVKTVGTLYNPKRSKNLIAELNQKASEKGINIIAVRIDEPSDAPDSLKALEREMDAFILLPDPTVANKDVFPQVLEFTIKKKIPLWAPSKAFVEAGALISLDYRYDGIGEQMCEIVKEIEKGKSPSEIGIVPPRLLDLTYNLNIAQQLNLLNLPFAASQYCQKERCKINTF